MGNCRRCSKRRFRSWEIQRHHSTVHGFKTLGCIAKFDKLNSIIEAFNRRFGDIDWGDGIDKIEVEEILTQQIPLKIGQNKEGLQYIINSDKSNAREESNNLVKSMMQGMMFTNTAIYKKFVDDDNFRRRYEEFIFDIVWSSQQGGRGEVR